MIKLIIFDIGGVLVRFDESQYIDYVSKKLGIDRAGFSADLNPLVSRMERGKLKLRTMELLLSKKYKVAASSLEWQAAFVKLVRENKETKALLNRLSKRYTVVLLTNVSRSRYCMIKHTMLEDLNYKRAFVSCYIGAAKPEARVYTHVLKEMRANPENAVFIDNTRANVDGAARVGIHAVHFTDYKNLINDLRGLGIKW